MVLNVSYAQSRADLLYDPARATVADMAGALSRFGYVTYSLNEKVQQIRIRVKEFGGFDRIPPIEQALRRIPGVKGVKTDILKREMTVTVGAGKVKRETLAAAVAEHGLEVIGR